jgi:hypothetical protein
LRHLGSLGRLILPSFTTVAVVLISPIVGQATQTTIGVDSSRETTLLLARTAEANHQWAVAYQHYATLLSEDRNQPEVRKRLFHCLRQCHRKYRLQDGVFINQVLGPQFRFGDALEFYRDVVRKVQEYYVRAEDVQIAKLFQHGVDEICLDLDDPDFRKAFLRPGATQGEIDEFRNALRMRAGTVRIRDVAEAIEQLRVVSREASRKLDLNPRLLVVEFACGIGNGLDEYSFYLTSNSQIEMPDDTRPSLGGELKDRIAYIHIHRFDDTTLQQLDDLLNDFRMSGMDGLILDLRDNDGGSVDVAVQVAERFLAMPLLIASTTGKVNRTYQSYGMNVVDVPMFVLIDETTVSAAELVAGALKAHRRAELIGTPTFGKSLIQRLVPLSCAPFGTLRLTWSQFHLPRMDDLSRNGGVTPTIPEPDRNKQLVEAYRLARQRMSMQ